MHQPLRRERAAPDEQRENRHAGDQRPERRRHDRRRRRRAESRRRARPSGTAAAARRLRGPASFPALEDPQRIEVGRVGLRSPASSSAFSSSAVCISRFGSSTASLPSGCQRDRPIDHRQAAPIELIVVMRAVPALTVVAVGDVELRARRRAWPDRRARMRPAPRRTDRVERRRARPRTPAHRSSTRRRVAATPPMASATVCGCDANIQPIRPAYRTLAAQPSGSNGRFAHLLQNTAARADLIPQPSRRPLQGR